MTFKSTELNFKKVSLNGRKEKTGGRGVRQKQASKLVLRVKHLHRSPRLTLFEVTGCMCGGFP